MPKTLSEPIASYFAAANAREPDRVAACFADNATVRDEGRDIHGRAGVRAWAEETGRKYRFRAEVTGTEQSNEETVVTAHLTGDFPGSPIDLRYRFKVARGLIQRLEIAP
ncbi:MAG: nuclear transport factor 2 family protein [Rhodospirillaceae bacterium]|nr:nuclear transport factor 2 family protein [Rhodospirillaceae bacterium]